MNDKEKLAYLIYCIRNNMVLTLEQENLARKLGLDLEGYKNSLKKDIVESTDSEVSQNNSLEKSGKVISLTNGYKQFDPSNFFNGNGFSDIYMFGFLILLFQTLFIVLSYMIFS